MRKVSPLIILFLVMWGMALPVAAITYDELAQHWAPRFYHDTNVNYDYEAEYFTLFNYDSNWKGIDNWENLYNYPKYSYIYYSVVETETHWFINYDAFHPRDDGPLFDQHENDFEGAVLAIKKDGSTYGSLHVMITMAHDDWNVYTNDPNIRGAEETVNGGILFDSYGRPEIYIQANGSSLDNNGHGWKAYDGRDAPGGDGIVYYYGGWAEVPTDGSGNWVHEYSYTLRPFSDLWDRRYDFVETYAAFGVFRGDTYQENAAKTPWYWDDADDGPAFNGSAWSDPAHLIDTHVTGLGNWSRNYVSNSQYTHKIVLYDVTSLADRDAFGNGSDIYLKIFVDGQIYWDERLWKHDDAVKGTAYPVKMGRDDALITTYDGDTNAIYIAKPAGSLIEIEVYDSDSTSGDDFMGSIEFVLNAGESIYRSGQLTSTGEAAVSFYAECVQ
ncbi:hypothetical protein BBF96_06035 [Anoxybacter fermentans]|uniref:Uncharacterized protein n=1 Tax=Anoxybacter fermentans TaxID=1323375 RepID=A0A3S9SXM1_9FIRM|nr:C2 domain-containing protein [Anoxybacter fermentans]AZR72992.1 hypothetical protein BBF96_06035 [Anoxybacter fermentans]